MQKACSKRGDEVYGQINSVSIREDAKRTAALIAQYRILII